MHAKAAGRIWPPEISFLCMRNMRGPPSLLQLAATTEFSVQGCLPPAPLNFLSISGAAPQNFCCCFACSFNGAISGQDDGFLVGKALELECKPTAARGAQRATTKDSVTWYHHTICGFPYQHRGIGICALTIVVACCKFEGMQIGVA